MSNVIQLENIIKGEVRKSAERRIYDGFSFPVTTEQDVSFALKYARVQKPVPVNKAIEALSRIGREATWITDDDLKVQAELSGSPIKHMRKSIDAVNTWLANIETYVLQNAKLYDLDSSEDSKTQVMLDHNGKLYRGGVTTMFVLAGDEVSIAPWNIAQALLANSSAIIKPSRIEPLSAYLFTRALIQEGIIPPALLYISRETEAEQNLVGKLIKQTQQSVIYGEDHTVKTICDPFGFRSDHKYLAYLTGRSGAIVLPDADVALAAQMIIRGATDDRGNRCNSTKKVYAPISMASALEESLIKEADKLVRGEPIEETTDLGKNDPQARVIAQGWASSAKVFYDRDMFLMTVDQNAQVLKEEVPYPTVAVCYYEEGQDPVKLANDSVSQTELGAAVAMSIFTQDENQYMHAASRILACKALLNMASTDFDFWTSHQGWHLFVELMRKTDLVKPK